MVAVIVPVCFEVTGHYGQQRIFPARSGIDIVYQIQKSPPIFLKLGDPYLIFRPAFGHLASGGKYCAI